MCRYGSVVACVVLLMVTACETKNVGRPPDPCRFAVTGVTLSDTSPLAGADVTATINYSAGCYGPYQFTVTFADCVTPAVQTFSASQQESSVSFTFTLDAFLLRIHPMGKDCSFTITATDAVGSIAGPVSASFHVDGIPSPLPNISTVFNAASCTVTAMVADGENSDVVVEATTVPASLTTIGPQTVVGGNGIVDFPFSPTDIIAGGSGTVTFTATNEWGGTATASAVVTCPGFVSTADTLYAVPAASNVNVGEPVTIMVLTGDPANSFRYMTSVSVVTDAASGFDYVNDSFNVGMPGGETYAVDGIWGDDELGLEDGDFLLPPDSFFVPRYHGGMVALDFNVTPLGASGDMHTGEGALFNFQATFTTPGTYQLGFQLFETVERTYYQDSNQSPNYYWGDITNNHAGIPNSVTVN